MPLQSVMRSEKNKLLMNKVGWNSAYLAFVLLTQLPPGSILGNSKILWFLILLTLINGPA